MQIQLRELQFSSNNKNNPSKNSNSQRSYKSTFISPQKQNKLSDKEILSRFDPFKIPPNIQQCLFHRLATQFGKPLQKNLNQYDPLKQQITPRQNLQKTINQSPQHLQKNSKHKICPCCGQQPKQQIPVCCRIQQVYKVNQALGFYFTYIKTMGLMLFLIIITVGAYALKQVISDCSSQKNCLKIYDIPVSKFHVFFTNILIIFNGGILLLMYFFIAYLYYTNAHVHRKIFLNHKKPSDYCVMLSGIDHQKVTGQAILNHFNNFDISDILYTHKIQKYVSKLSQKSILMAKRNLYFKKGAEKKVAKIEVKIDEINEYLFQIKNKLSQTMQKSIRTDKIIIKFKTPQLKKWFQKNYMPTLCESMIYTICGGSPFKINQNKMYIEQLGEPHQIVWQNLQVQSKQRYIRVLMGSLLTGVILGFSYLTVVFITKLQQNHNAVKDIILSIVFSVFLKCINFVLGILIQALTQWEKRYTLTGKIRAILVKNFISFFLNTTILPFTLFLFSWETPSEDDLVRNIFSLFLMSNFISPFVSLYVKPKVVIDIYKQWQIKRKGKQSIETQSSANQYFEKFSFDLNARYSLVIQIITNSIFYASVFPVGVIITFFGLIIAYWTSKWFLVKYCSIPKFSYRLGRLVNDITTVFPCILSFGYAFNIMMVPGKTQFNQYLPILFAVLTIPISLLFLLFGNRIAQKIVAKQYKGLQTLQNMTQKMKIQNNMQKHVSDYRQLNPTTFIHGEVHYKIKQKQFQNMWNHLQEYALDKQAHHLRRNSDLSQQMQMQDKLASAIQTNRKSIKI